MRLEDKFFNTFFYLFLVAILASIIIVIGTLIHFSGDFIDEGTASEVISIEKKYAKANINSMNILLSNLLLKLQVDIQQLVTLYQNIAMGISKSVDTLKFDDIDVYNSFELRDKINSHDETFKQKLSFSSLWFINNQKINISLLPDETKKQIYVFSLMTQSMNSIINSNRDILTTLYFVFDKTDLFLCFPFTYQLSTGFLDIFDNYTNNPAWCTDEEGEIITYYKFKCRNYYKDIMNAQKNLFDSNLENQKNRKIFITSPYPQFGNSSSNSVFTICIKFNDEISGNVGYACGDSEDHTLFSSFDLFNEKLLGYVSVTSVGFNQAFYFPQIMSGQYQKALGEFIYRFDNEYFLEEKTYFLNSIQKALTSNYIKNINKEEIKEEPLRLLDEIFIDGFSGKYQRFYINNKENYFSLYPIIIENMDKEKEHVLSIIYIYNKKSFYEHIFEYIKESNSELIFHFILYFFFACVLLYIITLSFKLLAKIIVIPIKNVHYMLEGINIGGEFRLKFISNLQKKQEDNLAKLNKINHRLMQNHANHNKNLDLTDLTSNEKNDKEKNQKHDISPVSPSNSKYIQKKLTSKSISSNKKKESANKGELKGLENSFTGNKTPKNAESKLKTKMDLDEERLNSSSNEINNNEVSEIKNYDLDEEYIDTRINYEKKYDADGIILEKELNFYDFDEELLQYRPVELNNLVQSLLNLKSALILTSKTQEVESIIGYTNSGYTFDNFKNQTGSRMCQSNIGNMQSRLDKYDKAIYHLCLSLQNVDLKKFLSSTLSDEYDENDSLLHKIELNYKKNKKEKEVNKLVKKQQRGKKVNFSQKIIEILINSRYNKLINIYLKFFSFIQKNNSNNEKLSECFMHTQFHTINYYHKILIQYIYLCYLSNDLVKIGESILDYIEFLIKFKLKTSEENSYIMNINNMDIPEIKEKQLMKRKYFDKIINWLNLFDSYAKQINENSALGNYKNILDAYSHNLQSNHNQFNSGNENASVLLFQINLQRCDFLRGKFALVCEDYNDALGFMINAALKKRIVIDGLIKKRALKHIAKIAEKLRRAIINKNYSKMNYLTFMEKDKIKLKKRDTNPINKFYLNFNEKENEFKSLRLIDKMNDIQEQIIKDINETNEKQLKDIIILIDCNRCIKLVVDSYIDVTKTILKNYLTNNDRIGVFFLLNEYRILSPMMRKDEIDMANFYKDMDIYSEKIFKKEKIEYSSMLNEELQEKINSESFDSINESKHNSFSETSSDFINNEGFINKGKIKIEDLINSINYCLNYLKMKEISTNEKYFFYFSSNIKEFMTFLSEMSNQDYLNNLSYESNQKNKIQLQKEKIINFIVVGKFKPENEEEYKSILMEFFGAKSDVIPFDNMKKIKSILSSNTIINDNIIFPNEVYKL